ncbi:riboflavin biosynthesis protein RibD [Roseibium aquae]|uniref:Riboflavin biosynthesis protein RibD n=1 Tax=Roseibium aquae TaxID=1323746 RepID=A0A916TMS2_9HYPH|nr:bifunctional diaminohydroxyphosphoribosylaminopyrimidine deaminase/5-amino-6-(5-phosphoribosylamino)uracil reductase RibD [Roseibium aquae]GGB56584.1 riboflavin biosynthesis protein RibD [Roseibium aquae]
MTSLQDIDLRFMAAAERLARRGLGRVWPNPPVAALIVRQDADGAPLLVGRGLTARPGGPHAEVNALAAAGERAQGATCYVTLEPCSHYGRTPPCSGALIEAGVGRVVVSMLDPNPRVAGRGVRLLREAGIEVVVGVNEAACQQLYKGFSLRITRNRPLVFLKVAMSRDGFIGREGEGQIAISGPLAMRHVHGYRAAYDAILVGIGTAVADDPQLTCRLPGLYERSPVRVVIDTRARLPLTSKLVRTAADVPVWVICGHDADPGNVEQLAKAGIRIIRVPAPDGRIEPGVAITALAARGITSVMVEGGARLADAFLRSGLVDDFCIVTGAVEVGAGGIPAFLNGNLDTVLADPRFQRVAAGHIGPDRFIHLKRNGA